MSAETVAIKGVRPLGEDPTTLVLRDGVIAELGPRVTAPAGARVLDADGLIALPGLVDLHAHLGTGNLEAETQAAALGGFTAVHAMPDTSPVADNAAVVEQLWRLGQQHGWTDVHPIGAVSAGLVGTHLAELGTMADSAARVRMFSDDPHCVSDPVLMRRALEYTRAFGATIAQHAQDPRLTEDAQMNEGALAGVLGLRGWPSVAEETILARDILLAAHVRGRLHACHVSTAGSVELLRAAKARGVSVSAEVAPHHLLLTEEAVRSYDPLFKVSPPLRTDTDVAALRAGLADGTIDAVASCHHPVPRQQKDCEWAAASPGMLGVQHALSVVQLAMVESGLLTWAQVAQRMSAAPARIGGLGSHPARLEVGAAASLVLVDPAARHVVSASELVSRATNVPYLGLELPGRVVATILRGRPTVWDAGLVER